MVLLKTFFRESDNAFGSAEYYATPEGHILDRMFELFYNSGLSLYVTFSGKRSVEYQTYLSNYDQHTRTYSIARFEELDANHAMETGQQFSVRACHNGVNTVFDGQLMTMLHSINQRVYNIEYPKSFICKSLRRAQRYFLSHDKYKIKANINLNEQIIEGRLIDISLMGFRMVTHIHDDSCQLKVGDILQSIDIYLKENLKIEAPIEICSFIPTAHNKNIINLGARFLVIDFQTMKALKKFCSELSGDFSPI